MQWGHKIVLLEKYWNFKLCNIFTTCSHLGSTFLYMFATAKKWLLKCSTIWRNIPINVPLNWFNQPFSKIYLGTFQTFMEYFKQPNYLFLPPVILNEIIFSRLFQNDWTFWNEGTFIWKYSHIPMKMCTNRREPCNFFQKVQPKGTKVELIEGIFLRKHIYNICLLLKILQVWGLL